MELTALPMPLTLAPGPGEDPETARPESGGLRMVAPARTDLFHDPAGTARTTTAPRLVGPAPAGDFQLSARVGVGFAGTYDAGALLVWADDAHWAKLCFERSPQGEALAVSVVTRDVSDDANGFVVPAGRPLDLRVSRLGATWAFHARVDDQPWVFVRHFALGGPADVAVGFVAQSPLGDGCVVTFEAITFTATTLADLRDGR